MTRCSNPFDFLNNSLGCSPQRAVEDPSVAWDAHTPQFETDTISHKTDGLVQSEQESCRIKRTWWLPVLDQAQKGSRGKLQYCAANG